MVSDQAREIIARYHGSNLINILNELQSYAGFLKEEDLGHLAKTSGIAMTKIYSMASFYSFLKLEDHPKNCIRICTSPSCHLNGSDNVINIVKELTGLSPGEKDSRISVEFSSCIGCCDKPPAIMINENLHTGIDKEKLKALLEKLE